MCLIYLNFLSCNQLELELFKRKIFFRDIKVKEVEKIYDWLQKLLFIYFSFHVNHQVFKSSNKNYKLIILTFLFNLRQINTRTIAD